MSKFDEIFDKLSEAESSGTLPLSVPSSNVKSDQKQLLRIFKDRGIRNIGVSTEEDKGLIWFRKRKK